MLPKYSKMPQKGPKWSNMVLIIILKCFKMVQNYPKCPKMSPNAQKDFKCSRMLKNALKVIPNDAKWSKMVKHNSKASKTKISLKLKFHQN